MKIKIKTLKVLELTEDNMSAIQERNAKPFDKQEQLNPDLVICAGMVILNRTGEIFGPRKASDRNLNVVELTEAEVKKAKCKNRPCAAAGDREADADAIIFNMRVLKSRSGRIGIANTMEELEQMIGATRHIEWRKS